MGAETISVSLRNLERDSFPAACGAGADGSGARVGAVSVCDWSAADPVWRRREAVRGGYCRGDWAVAGGAGFAREGGDDKEAAARRGAGAGDCVVFADGCAGDGGDWAGAGGGLVDFAGPESGARAAGDESAVGCG